MYQPMDNTNPLTKPKRLSTLLFTFQGRLNRGQLLIRLLGLAAFNLLMYGIIFALGHLAGSDTLVWGLMTLVAVPSILASLSLHVRRWHDLDRSGWHVVLNLIPYVGGLVFLYILLAPGSDGDNHYGKLKHA
ncbi:MULTISPECIES: DUF805 domain-containing protein [unclassified Paludibacterium]|uniref:DUF805 domain-containing protein n=1 Tax=unclassified Paludibacterium TaxID=2618429 RepID=UPI001C043F8A|nr:DUF805 domain-containing protein [Paludibacterium sp. B53371]BEV72952.1 DUF805 domain-containing protein [Paludibacterium sp. THUN1379]